MILHPNTLKVSKAASTDVARFNFKLSGVHIASDGSAVATDGHQLVKWTPTETVSGENYPAIEGMNANNKNAVLKPFTLPIKSAVEILKAVPKRRTLPVLENIALDVNASNNNPFAVLGVTDLKNPRIFKPKKLDEEYPDYNKIIPAEDKKPTFEIGLRVDVLLKMLNTIKSLYPGGKPTAMLKFKFYGPNTAIRIEGHTDTGEIVAVIMPMRL